MSSGLHGAGSAADAVGSAVDGAGPSAHAVDLAVDRPGSGADLIAAIANEERVIAELPGGGRLHLDRRLPYLLVYRRPPGQDDAGTAALVLGEASYAILDGAMAAEAYEPILRAIVKAGSSEFGAFLLLELWAGPAGSHEYRVQGPREEGAETVAVLAESLGALRAGGVTTEVVVESAIDRHPADMPALLTPRECRELACLSLGLVVPPVWRGEADALYPVFLRTYKRGFSRALRQGLHGFIRVQTTAGIDNYRMLGPSRIDALTLEADRELAAIEESYAFLLLISPVNEEEAWEEFLRQGYDREPELHYRLLPVDPDLLKRRLFEIPLEHVEDPAMAYLLRDKREELDRQISMLAERGTPDFRASSMRLYKGLSAVLLEAAGQILREVPLRSERHGDATPVDAMAFAARARREIEAYRAAYDGMASTVTIRDDTVGLMVSRGQLLIGHGLHLRADRVEALIQHEVGTHVLTFANGAAQPLHQLRHGLAGYDELQEGLAVFAEYLVDGLSRLRLRLLAARVLAVHSMLGGATFLDTFRLIRDEHGFTANTAFSVAVRVHQAGGFSRDMIYLRGLLRLLRHLAGGGELEPLYIGKIAEKHIPVIQELRERGVLRPPPLRPRFLDAEGARRRIEAVRGGLHVTRLVRGAEA
jgi:uncharacterized protein (TIGR02421 family)